ncbi:MAG: hypothetical protein IKP86_09890 [Anaerolineaceae bacterium]|nr:hypothetical protein [Anaerolineaceae bacterium]
MQTTRIAAVLILIMAIVYFLCRLLVKKIKFANLSHNREKDRLIRRHIARSLEESAPIHLDLGDSGESALGGGSMLSAAGATETVSAQMAFADEPWVITAPGGLASNLEKDALHMGMKAAAYGSSDDMDCTVYSAPSPMEHAAGNAAALDMAPSALHLAIGSFGTAPALTDTHCSKGEFLCVGGEDLVSQAVGTVSADAVYVGEQFAEIPGALDREEKQDPSLLAMDVIRWLVIGSIIIFAGFGLSGL